MPIFKSIDCTPFGNDGYLLFRGQTSSTARDNLIWDMRLTEDIKTDMSFRCRFSNKAMEEKFGIVGPFLPQEQAGGMVIGKISQSNPTVQLEVRGPAHSKFDDDIFLDVIFLPLQGPITDTAMIDLWRGRDDTELQNLPYVRFRFRREEQSVEKRVIGKKTVKKSGKSGENISQWSWRGIFIVIFVILVVIFLMYLVIQIFKGNFCSIADWKHRYFGNFQ